MSDSAQNPETTTAPASATSADIAPTPAAPVPAQPVVQLTAEQLAGVVAQAVIATQQLQAPAATTAPAGFDGSNIGKARNNQEHAEKFFAEHPTEMTLENLLASDLPIYIKNNVNIVGQISIDFVISGRRKTVVIPNTWLPISLNDLMSSDDIAACGSLRNHLRKGSVILIHPKKARELLMSERGQRESAKYRSQYANSEAVAALNIPNTSEDVGDRMKSYMASYQEASTDAARQNILDEVFNSTRTFSMADLNYFRGVTAGNPSAEKQFAEMVTEINTQLETAKA
jgi:hypothetical protein